MPKDLKAEIEGLFHDTFGAANVKLKDLNLEDALKASVGLNMSAAAQTLSAASKLKREFASAKKEFYNLNPEEIVEKVLDPISKDLRAKLGDAKHSLQKNLIRMIVTHPGTSALNAIGWVHASTMQSVSDAIRGTLYGTRSGLSYIMGNNTSAVEFGLRSRLMFGLQKQKFFNLENPYGTFEEVLDYMTLRPQAREKLFRYMSGGVETGDVLRDLGLTAGKPVPPGKFETFLETMQHAYGVRAIDMLSKTQEFLYSLDKQVRLNYGKSWQDFVRDPQLAINMKGAKYVHMETVAVEDALRNVFAKKYGGSKGILPRFAGMLEEARNIPIVGAMVPFGQFFNNTLGFIFDHTGISLMHRFVVGGDRDLFELATKTAAGITTMGILAHYEKQSLKEGLAWHETRTQNGEVVSKQFDFPLSFFKMAGRILAHISEDGEAPPELVQEFFKVFGPQTVTRQLGDSAAFLQEAISSMVTGEGDDSAELFKKALGSSISMYASGYTRFLDPFNQALAVARGDEYVALDRKQGYKFVNDSMRYTDQIFAVLKGEEIAPERFKATSTEPLRATPGRVFGYRVVPKASSTERMFNEAGRPQWRTEIGSSLPELDNELSRTVAEALEYHADRILQSKVWQEASAKDRDRYLKKVLNFAEADVKEKLTNSYDYRDNKMALLLKLTSMGGGVSKRELKAALDDFGLDKKDLWTLEYPQLQLLDQYLKRTKTSQKQEKNYLGLN